MNKLNRRKFIETGIASGLGIAFFPGIGCNPNGKTTGSSNKNNKEMDRIIPDWLRYPRFYTIDHRRDRVKDEDWVTKPGEISELVKKIGDNGGSAFRLGLYWGAEVYYQSKIAPHASRLGQLDYLREAIEQGKKSGVKIVAYINPNAIYDDLPMSDRLAIRDNQGNIWDEKAYRNFPARYGCINNPEFRKFLLDVLREIFTEYETNGLYVDGLSPHVCFCEYCKAKYKDIFNADLPEKFQELGPFSVLWEMASQPELVGDPQDPDSKLYTQFMYQNLIDITRDFTNTVKSSNPDAVVMYHSWPKPDIIQYYDGTLGEIYTTRPWIHVLWKTAEMTSYGAVFPGLVVLQNLYLEGEKTNAQARHKAYQILANGMFPNFWYFLEMKTVFNFLHENEHYFDFVNTKPVKFIAFPRGISTDVIQRKINNNHPVPVPRDRFLAPYVGCYSALLLSGLPIVTVHRPDFHEKIADFKVLCLVNEAGMSDLQVEVVRQFVADGGGLIATGETSLYDQIGQRRPDFALKDLFGVSYLNTLPADNRHLEFDGLHDINKGLEKLGFDYDEPLTVVNPDDGVVRGWIEDNGIRIPAVLTNTYGSGRVVYIPARLDSIQCEKLTPAIEKLFANTVYWLTQGNIPVQIDADKTVGVTLYDQLNRRLLHLLNFNADTMQVDEQVESIYNIKIKMSIPEGHKIVRLHQLMHKSELQFDNNGNWLEFTIPELGEYEVVVMEFE